MIIVPEILSHIHHNTTEPIIQCSDCQTSKSVGCKGLELSLEAVHNAHCSLGNADENQPWGPRVSAALSAPQVSAMSIQETASRSELSHQVTSVKCDLSSFLITCVKFSAAPGVRSAVYTPANAVPVSETFSRRAELLGY